MSAASPNVQDKGQEPSMEEILASIRRIIADDQVKPEPVAAPKPAPKVVPEPEPEPDDVLDLAEVATPVRKPEPLGFDAAEIDFKDIEEEPEPVFEPPPAPPKAPPRLQAAIEQQTVERLVSKTTDDSVGQAFQLLSSTVMSRNARTVEDLVVDMLRPMLQSWLDDNLPGMVERLVKAEIERVARGR